MFRSAALYEGTPGYEVGEAPAGMQDVALIVDADSEIAATLALSAELPGTGEAEASEAGAASRAHDIGTMLADAAGPGDLPADDAVVGTESARTLPELLAGALNETADSEAAVVDAFELFEHPHVDESTRPLPREANTLGDPLVGDLGSRQLTQGLHQTIDPDPPRPEPRAPLFSTADDQLLHQLLNMDLRDDLRQSLNQSPALLRALVQQALSVLLKPEAKRTSGDWRLLVIDAWRRGNFEEALARTEAMENVAQSEEERVEACLQRALVLEKLGRQRQAVDAFGGVADDNRAATDVGALAGVAQALLHRGVLQRRDLHDFPAARTTLNDLIDRFGDQRDGAFPSLLVRGLINLALVESGPGGNVARAIALYDRVLAEFGQSDDRQVETSVAQAQFNRAVLLYERNQDVEGALQAYQQLTARFSGRRELDIALLIANALANRGWLLARQGNDFSGALASYRELDQQFGEHRDRDIALLVARGLFAAASITTQDLRSPKAAVDLYQALVRRYNVFPGPEFSLLVAKSLFNVGVILALDASTVDQALFSYDALIDRYLEQDEPLLWEWVASAMVNKANLIAHSPDAHTRALAIYWHVVRVFGQHSEAGVGEQVAKALLNIGGIEHRMEDLEGATAAYDELSRRYAGTDDVRTAQIVARGLSNLAALHATSRQDPDAALRAFGELVTRYGQRPEVEIAEQVARALFSMGVLLGTSRKDPDAAVATYDALMQRYGERSEAAIVQQVVKGLFNQAALQAREQHDLQAALRSLQMLLDRYADREEPGVVERVVSAMVNKGRIEHMSGAAVESRATFARVVAQFGQRGDPQITKHVDAARRALADVSAV